MQTAAPTMEICLCLSYIKIMEPASKFPCGYDFLTIKPLNDEDPSRLRNVLKDGDPSSPRPHLRPPFIHPSPQEAADQTRWCSLGSKIYGVGGHFFLYPNGPDFSPMFELSRSLSVFDTEFPENGWMPCSPMNKARDNCQVAVAGGKLYVFGSSRGNDDYACGEVYDPEKDKWTALNPPPLRYARFRLFSAILNVVIPKLNKILVWYGRNRCLSFDLINQIWEPSILDELLHPLAALAVENMLYTLCIYDGLIRLCAIDLLKEEQSDLFEEQSGCTVLIHNLEELHPCPPRQEKLNRMGCLPEYKRYLFHLGDQQFCIVWSDIFLDQKRLFLYDDVDEDKGFNLGNCFSVNSIHIIHCFKFSISPSTNTCKDFDIVVHGCDCYYARGVSLTDCFPLDEDHQGVKLQAKNQVSKFLEDRKETSEEELEDLDDENTGQDIHEYRAKNTGQDILSNPKVKLSNPFEALEDLDDDIGTMMPWQ